MSLDRGSPNDATRGLVVSSEAGEPMCWGRDRTAGLMGVSVTSRSTPPPPLEVCPPSSTAGLAVAVDIARVGESRTPIREPLPPPAAIVALNARLNEKIDWADGCQAPVFCWRLCRCRIAIMAVAARIDASSSSLSVDEGAVALLSRPWLHSGFGRPSLRKGRGTATEKRPSGGGYELDERGSDRPLETEVGDDDEDAAFDGICGGKWSGCWGFRLSICVMSNNAKTCWIYWMY